MPASLERSSSEAGGQSRSFDQGSESGRTIPVYFRLVPKDVWIRMHIDTRATIGSIKDSFLDRVGMSSHDPSLGVNFYDDARSAMSRQNVAPQEARSLPKAFVARAPKRTIKEVMKAEADNDADSLFASNSKKASAANRWTPSVKSVPAASQARAILGGDAGTGGRGTLGFVGANVTLDDDDASHLEHGSAYHYTPRSLFASPSIPAHSTPDVRNSIRKHLTSQHQASPQGMVRTLSSTQNAKINLDNKSSASSSYDSHPAKTQSALDNAFVVSGLVDAETWHRMGGKLPGNEEAKRMESEAMMSFRANEVRNGPSVHDAYDEDAGLESDEKRELPDVTLGCARQSLHSSSSSLVEENLDADIQAAVASPSASDKANSLSSPSLSSGVVERARSGTIVPTEAQRRAALNASLLINGSATPSTIHTISSNEAHVPEPDLIKLPSSQLGCINDVASQVADTATEITQSVVNKRANDSFTIAIPSNPTSNTIRRLAGIYTDEISSWRDAQHGQAKYYTIHSFSNGHVLEDWRTAAAFRLRPYELLEVQYADLRDKIHLPRSGEATNICARKGLPKPDKDDAASSFNPPSIGGNPALDGQYLEPYAECWAYIFKRGSGTSRTQKAGLGLWKLRWICLHSNRIFIFRSKPQRYEFDEAIVVWNLDGVETVFSERGDGVTRPHLPYLSGQCKDILSITFRPPPGVAGTEDWPEVAPASVSLRFITQLDHCAFFRSCSRAHYRAVLRRKDVNSAAAVFEWRRRAVARATIAGMGGTVMPGKAARRGGRNALSRARLRPAGVKRDFDDADRWSSGSETEEHIVSASNAEQSEQERFLYAVAQSILPPADLDVSTFTPVTMGNYNSYFSVSNEASPVPGGRGGQQVQPKTSGLTPSSIAAQRRPSVRQRGFTTSHILASDSHLEDNLAYGSPPGVAKLQHAYSMRTLSSQGVGLGMTTGDPSASKRNFTEPVPVLITTPAKDVSVSADSRPSTVAAIPFSSTTGTDNGQSALRTRQRSFAEERPIVTPDSELEQSPAAQAIHSFLAQRASSISSNLSRTRSTTIGVPSDARANGSRDAINEDDMFSFDRSSKV